MTQKYIPLGQLTLPNGHNPRHVYDKARIKGLAESIKQDGVLQNLVVEPSGSNTYHILSGKRRFLALKLLKRQGDIDDGYKVPVSVKRDLEDGEALRIATVENVQREALDPLDEAEAFALLLRDGVDLDDICAKTGVSHDIVRRRLALANLSADAKTALRKGEITLSIAEALTLGSGAQQQFFIDAVRDGAHLRAQDVRETIVAQSRSFPRSGTQAPTQPTSLAMMPPPSSMILKNFGGSRRKRSMRKLTATARSMSSWTSAMNIMGRGGNTGKQAMVNRAAW
jgi:ParB family transcriptional regulator, chromosome partitioning protein